MVANIYCRLISKKKYFKNLLDTCFMEKVCENNGGCLITTEEPYYKCLCDVGFSGKNCEIEGFLYKCVIYLYLVNVSCFFRSWGK